MAQVKSASHFVVNGGVGPGTYGPFTLTGGKYALIWSATVGGGNLQLQVLSPDQTTYVNAIASITAAGMTVFDIPDATYQIVITTSTANNFIIDRISRYFSQ